MRLSVCIATYNRALFIGETLESIICQLGDDMEIVIVDGASPDNTAAVVCHYAAHCPAIRYFRETMNSGVDADYDKAVTYAAGAYCWLMTDDDVLEPDAIERVLKALEGGVIDLLVVDAEIRDRTLKRSLNSHRLGFTGERRYGPAEADAFMRDAGDALSFIGGVIVRRSAWLARDRELYLGSLFVHAGVIFQSPPMERIKVLGQSLVRIRAGNAMWRARSLEIWALKWPALIWSFDHYSASAREAVTPREPWRGLVWIARFRAMGAFSVDELRHRIPKTVTGGTLTMLWIVAVIPGPLMNLLGVCLLALLGRGGGEGVYDLVVSSRYSNPMSRWLARLWLGDAARHRLGTTP